MQVVLAKSLYKLLGISMIVYTKLVLSATSVGVRDYMNWRDESAHIVAMSVIRLQTSIQILINIFCFTDHHVDDGHECSAD